MEEMIYFAMESLSPFLAGVIAMTTGFVLVVYLTVIISSQFFQLIVGRNPHASK